MTDQTVWTIGILDKSSLDFSGFAKGPVTFRIGQSDWRKEWPRYQPTGQPFKILFPLKSTSGLYTLRISALLYRARIPRLSIELNGHGGLFYFNPKLSYFTGDPQSVFDPHYSESLLIVELPTSLLKTDENTLVLSCVNDPVSPAGEENFSGLNYDALSLTQDDSASYDPAKITADVQATPFYHESAGGLTEVVDAVVRSNGPLSAGKATLHFQNKTYEAVVPEVKDFGEHRVSLDIPEWNKQAAARLDIEGGAKHQSLEATLIAQRKWTAFVVPHTHLDIGYTDYQGKVAEMQPRVISQAAGLIRKNPDFRFSMDGSWNLEQLLDTRSAEQQKEIIDLIRDGKITMPVQYCNVLTGYASLETLYRSLYPSREIARRYGLPFSYANITDVPTYSGSYPSVLASSNVKYWVAASNNDRAPIFARKHWNEDSPFWWQGPDGKKVLFWYSRHYMQVQTMFGLPPSLDAVRESLPIYLQAFSHPDYRMNAVLIYGTQVENTDLYPSTATFATEWNKRFAYPKLIYATFPDFFRYVEEHHENELPTYKLDGGPYWEDGIGSDAYFTAQDRRNQSRALTAEILATAMHTLDPEVNAPKGLVKDIWRNIVLFAEHTWTAYNSVSQPDHEESVKQLRVKDERATRAAVEIEDLMNRSLSQLADKIHIPANTLVVFNSLNWKRDALVETDLLEHAKLTDLATNRDVPLEVIEHKTGFLRVRFLAEGLPSFGYHCFRITYDEAGPAVPNQPDLQKSTTVENTYYRVEIDPTSGALASICDKQLGRELVATASPYKFGQYLYVTGGDGKTQMINPYFTLPRAQLKVFASGQGALTGWSDFDWGQSIRLRSSTFNTPVIDTEILLFNKTKRIEFRYHVQKQYTNAKEAVYFAFPIAASSPHFAYAAQQGWIDPSRDLMKGASLECFNIQGWMAAHDDKAAISIVPVDAPLASFGDINRGTWPAEFRPETPTIFSYAMNNYWHTNYRAGQGGDFTFRYVMTSLPTLDVASFSRLGLESMRPPEVNDVVGQDKAGNPARPLPPEGAEFLETTNPDVALVTWKQAEDGRGTILRFLELSGKKAETNIHFLRANVTKANLCTGVEDDRSEIPVSDNTIKLSLDPYEVVTVRAGTP
jgi:alpha-mannosidase